MTNLNIQFGKQLSKLRKQRGLTQEKLAEMVGVSVEFISYMERGINSPSFSTLEKLADSLDIPVKDFFDFQNQ